MSRCIASQSNYVVLEAIFAACLYTSSLKVLIKNYLTESGNVRGFFGLSHTVSSYHLRSFNSRP